MDKDKICRTCMKDNIEFLKSIFSEDSELSVPIAEMITVCSSTTVNEFDGLPLQICNLCEGKLKRAYNFRLQCNESYRALQEIYNKSIKTEILITEPDINLKLENTVAFVFEPDTIESDSEDNSSSSNFEESEEDSVKTDNSEVNESPQENSSFEITNEGINNQIENNSKLYKRLEEIGISYITLPGSDGKKQYQCKVCAKVFGKASHVKRHLLIHSPYPKPYKCDKCDYTFSTKDHLSRHSKVHRKYANSLEQSDKKSEKTKEKDFVSNLFECNYCPEVFKDISEYKTHKKIHKKNALNWQPDLMKKEINERQEAYENIKEPRFIYGAEDENTKHEAPGGSEIFKTLESIGISYSILPPANGKKQYECKVCSKIFHKTFHVKRHLLVHSPFPKPHKCEKCDKSFSSKDHLVRHSSVHEENAPRFVCDYCGKSFARIYGLKSHILQHTDAKPEKVKVKNSAPKVYKCKVCQEVFGEKLEYQEHNKQHKKENAKTLLCPECGLCFGHKKNLIVHLQRHQGIKPFKCQFCPKTFIRPSDCQLHEKYHTEARQHICNICQKGFYRLYDLKVHTRIHTGERPYQCPHCPKSFVQGNDLKSHIRRHTGEKFKCEICGEDFWLKYKLTKHQRNEHGMDVKSHVSRLEKVTPTTYEST